MNHAATPGLTVRTISPTDHAGFIRSLDSASFLQTPAWGEVKADWRRESIGWYDGQHRLVGAGVVLYRQIPRIKRHLAYLPEGPVIDWSADNLSAWLAPMIKHLSDQGAFGIRMGPPVVARRWRADTIKKAIADGAPRRLRDVPPDERDGTGERLQEFLRHSGWRAQEPEDGFGLGQPQYVFQLPLAGRSEDDVLAGMNQLWRRNIKKAAKLGVEVTQGDTDDLPEFHRIYRETAQRDGFTARPLEYFQRMFDALLAEDADRIRLYLAHHEGALVAATTWVRVGTHTWYSYGASTVDKREVRGSNAIQWRMIQDSLAVGAQLYDLRGITDSLEHDDPHIGLIRFKVGTGGEAVEYVGEWDLPISRVLYSMFDAYMRRR